MAHAVRSRLLPPVTGALAHAPRRTGRLAGRAAVHVHWFRRSGDDPFSGASLYRCRCGVVQPGI